MLRCIESFENPSFFLVNSRFWCCSTTAVVEVAKLGVTLDLCPRCRRCRLPRMTWSNDGKPWHINARACDNSDTQQLFTVTYQQRRPQAKAPAFSINFHEVPCFNCHSGLVVGLQKTHAEKLDRQASARTPNFPGPAVSSRRWGNVDMELNLLVTPIRQCAIDKAGDLLIYCWLVEILQKKMGVLTG